MKKFDVKSVIAGVVIGTLGITTAFAATGIKSATLSDAKIVINEAVVPLDKSLVSVTMDNEQSASLYMPMQELLEYLGYSVEWNEEQQTVILEEIKITAEAEAALQAARQSLAVPDEAKSTASVAAERLIFDFSEPINVELESADDDKHMAKLDFAVWVKSKDDYAILNENKPQIMECVTNAFQQYTYEEVTGAEFMENFSMQMVNEINTLLGKDILIEFFLTNFAVATNSPLFQ